MGRDLPLIQNGPGSCPVSCTMCTGSFWGVKYSRVMPLTTHPFLVPRSWKSKAIPLPTIWATPRPVTRDTVPLHLPEHYVSRILIKCVKEHEINLTLQGTFCVVCLEVFYVYVCVCVTERERQVIP